MSVDGAPLVSIEGDPRRWAEPISRPTEDQKPPQVTRISLDDLKPYVCVFLSHC